MDLFKNKKVKYDLRDSSKHTPIFYAIKLLNIDLVKKLIEKSSVNTDNVRVNGITPLRYILNQLYNHLGVVNQIPQVNFKFTENLSNILNNNIIEKTNNKIKLNTIQYIYKFLTSMMNHNFLLRSKQFKKKLERLIESSVELDYNLLTYFNNNKNELENINGDKILSEYNENIKQEKENIEQKIKKLKLFKVSEKNIQEEINKKINHLEFRLSKIKEYKLQNHILSTKNKLINIKPNEIDSIDKLYDNILNIFKI